MIPFSNKPTNIEYSAKLSLPFVQFSVKVISHRFNTIQFWITFSTHFTSIYWYHFW